MKLHCLSVMAAALLALIPTCVTSQTVRVRLLNAKNGKPIAKRFVSVVFSGKEYLPEMTRLTDDTGVAIFTFPAGADQFFLMGGGTEKEPYRTA